MGWISAGEVSPQSRRSPFLSLKARGAGRSALTHRLSSTFNIIKHDSLCGVLRNTVILD